MLVLWLLTASFLPVFAQSKRRSAESKYVSPDGSFEFSFPSWLKQEKCEWDGAPFVKVCLRYPHNAYRGYDFVGAEFRVGSGWERDTLSTPAKEITSANNCARFEDRTAPVSFVKIHGIEFATIPTDGVATGTAFDGRAYRTFHNGTCYEIDYTIAFTSPGFYDDEDYRSGAIKRFTPSDSKKVGEVMDRILRSFRFLP